jgi:anti-sigma B factor antagonist
MTCTSPGHDASAGSGTRLAAQAPGELLRIAVQADSGGTSTLRVAGDVDLSTAPLLRSRAMKQLAQNPQRLILDLRKVDFLGSSGLAALIEIRNEALRRTIGLQLVTASRAVLRPLIATGLIKLFDVVAGDSSELPPRQGGG